MPDPLQYTWSMRKGRAHLFQEFSLGLITHEPFHVRRQEDCQERSHQVIDALYITAGWMPASTKTKVTGDIMFSLLLTHSLSLQTLSLLSLARIHHVTAAPYKAAGWCLHKTRQPTSLNDVCGSMWSFLTCLCCWVSSSIPSRCLDGEQGPCRLIWSMIRHGQAIVPSVVLQLGKPALCFSFKQECTQARKPAGFAWRPLPSS